MPTPRSIKEIETSSADKKFRKTFVKVAVPEQDAVLPKNISSMTSAKISDLQLTYAAWRELAEDLLMEALVEYTTKKSKYDYEYDKKLLVTSGGTVKEKEAKVSTDQTIYNLYLELEQSEMYHTMLSNKLESYNNVLTVISREITRRSNDSMRS